MFLLPAVYVTSSTDSNTML